ncbi:MAG TPA: HNH endonuclease [Microthrixaceae bacterium]|nr:HNH endonuclease [Microthrixaceae bacterium]
MRAPERPLNRQERREQILQRDGPTCVWCERRLEGALVRATTEHVVPRIKGGPSWIENEVAACSRCNRSRGHVSPAEWADQCELLGMSPDRARLVARLEAVEARIAVEGGQRRARPYVAGQLRRLRHA